MNPWTHASFPYASDRYGQQDDDAAKRIGEEKTAEVEENAIATKEKGSFPAV